MSREGGEIDRNVALTPAVLFRRRGANKRHQTSQIALMPAARNCPVDARDEAALKLQWEKAITAAEPAQRYPGETMKMPSSKLAHMFARYRRKLLHLFCFLSIVAVIFGCFCYRHLGPMGVILPSVVAIGACLSEIDRFFEPGYAGRPVMRRLRPERGKGP